MSSMPRVPDILEAGSSLMEWSNRYAKGKQELAKNEFQIEEIRERLKNARRTTLELEKKFEYESQVADRNEKVATEMKIVLAGIVAKSEELHESIRQLTAILRDHQGQKEAAEEQLKIEREQLSGVRHSRIRAQKQSKNIAEKLSSCQEEVRAMQRYVDKLHSTLAIETAAYEKLNEELDAINHAIICSFDNIPDQAALNASSRIALGLSHSAEPTQQQGSSPSKVRQAEQQTRLQSALDKARSRNGGVAPTAQSRSVAVVAPAPLPIVRRNVQAVVPKGTVSNPGQTVNSRPASSHRPASSSQRDTPLRTPSHIAASPSRTPRQPAAVSPKAVAPSPVKPNKKEPQGASTDLAEVRKVIPKSAKKTVESPAAVNVEETVDIATAEETVDVVTAEETVDVVTAEETVDVVTAGESAEVGEDISPAEIPEACLLGNDVSEEHDGVVTELQEREMLNDEGALVTDAPHDQNDLPTEEGLHEVTEVAPEDSLEDQANSEALPLDGSSGEGALQALEIEEEEKQISLEDRIAAMVAAKRKERQTMVAQQIPDFNNVEVIEDEDEENQEENQGENENGVEAQPMIVVDTLVEEPCAENEEEPVAQAQQSFESEAPPLSGFIQAQHEQDEMPTLQAVDGEVKTVEGRTSRLLKVDEFLFDGLVGQDDQGLVFDLAEGGHNHLMTSDNESETF